jgi:hypothetical protein
MNVSVFNPTDVYTLMSATYPAATELASIQFIGTGGADVTYQLIGGSDIRDYYEGSFVNTLNNTVSGVNALNAFTCNDPSNCLGGAGSGSDTGTGNVNNGLTGNYLIDEQDFSLAGAFAGQTLTQIIITDTQNGSDPILLGATVGSQPLNTGATPEPSSLLLLGTGLVVFAGMARRKIALRVLKFNN